MPEVAGPDKADLVEEEARLARAAASGDGTAFATLYERYAQRAYNLAFRLSDSEEDAADAVQEAFLNVMRRLPELGADRDLAFGSYLFTATRNATYDILRRAQRARPSDSIPESAVPVGVGAGGLGLDPGDPEEDPDRRQLLSAQQEEIREANARLPERQREALALRELEDLSYDEIAELMEMNRNSVAQLISRARINLRDELRGTALASVTAASAECERALPLLAMSDDGQLAAGSADADWLASHLDGCDRCRLASEAMQEAGVSYRAWIPLALAPFLLRETMARAAELTGSDWSEAIERAGEAAPDPASIPGLPPAYLAAASARGGRRRRRAAALIALGVLVLAGGIAAIAAGGGAEPDPAPPVPAAEAEPAPPAPAATHAKAQQRHRAKRSPAGKKAAAGQTTETEVGAPPVPGPVPVESASGGQATRKGAGKARNGGAGGVDESRPAAAEPQAPAKEPPPASPPGEEPAPVEEEAPPREPEEPGPEVPLPEGPNTITQSPNDPQP